MAVLAYAAEHYPRWREELDDPGLAHGAFGENITVDGANEHTVCIGDVFCRRRRWGGTSWRPRWIMRRDSPGVASVCPTLTNGLIRRPR